MSQSNGLLYTPNKLKFYAFSLWKMRKVAPEPHYWLPFSKPIFQTFLLPSFCYWKGLRKHSIKKFKEINKTLALKKTTIFSHLQAKTTNKEDQIPSDCMSVCAETCQWKIIGRDVYFTLPMGLNWLSSFFNQTVERVLFTWSKKRRCLPSKLQWH